MFSEFPLYLFTLLGGLAAGAYAVAPLFGAPDGKRSRLLPLISLILLAISGVALLFHLGHPEKMLLAFRNPSAGITQEGIATVLFGVAVAADLIASFAKPSNARAIRIVGAVTGLLLVLAMSAAYASYRAVAAWGSWETFAFFLLTDLAMGVTLVGVLDSGLLRSRRFIACALSLVACGVVGLIIEAVHFVDVGSDASALGVGAGLALVAAAMIYLAKRRSSGRIFAAAFALVLLAVAVGRYGFYVAFAV